MAQFQKREYHDDITKKRTLTTGDVAFLAELQKELNTQPNMGNAAPVYWGIAQEKETPTAEDFSDSAVAVDQDGEIVARDLEALCIYLDAGDGCELLDGGHAAYFNQSCTIHFEDGSESSAYGIAEAVEALQDHGIQDIEIRYVRKETEILRDCMFLTHKDCEEHLEAYGYNYGDDAHAYAMTAVRSPRVERLLKLIQEVDWSRLVISGTGGA